MAKRQADSSSNLRRRAPSREPKTRIVAICEGQRTEPGYLHSLVRGFRNQIFEVEIIAQGGDPWAIVQRAVERKNALERAARRSGDSNDRRFQVWAIFDVDQHARFADACDRARATGIRLAISNPCFELWAVYHFEDCHRPLSTTEAIALLSTHIPRYGRGAKTFTLEHFETLDVGKQAVEAAITRGEIGLQRRAQEQRPLGSPSSTCGGLVRLLVPP